MPVSRCCSGESWVLPKNCPFEVPQVAPRLEAELPEVSVAFAVGSQCLCLTP